MLFTGTSLMFVRCKMVTKTSSFVQPLSSSQYSNEFTAVCTLLPLIFMLQFMHVHPPMCVCVCVTMKKVPDEWQARQATPAILQVSSSKENYIKRKRPVSSVDHCARARARVRVCVCLLSSDVCWVGQSTASKSLGITHAHVTAGAVFIIKSPWPSFNRNASSAPWQYVISQPIVCPGTQPHTWSVLDCLFLPSKEFGGAEWFTVLHCKKHDTLCVCVLVKWKCQTNGKHNNRYFVCVSQWKKCQMNGKHDKRYRRYFK